MNEIKNDLPIPGVPIHTLHLPSTGKEIRVRPFLVKEEKLLLMAAQTKDPFEIASATQRAVQDCLIDKDIDVEKLAFFDVDYLIVALRAKSIAPTVEVNFRCRNVIDNEECGHIFTVPLDIANSNIEKEDIPDKISLDSQMGVKFKYPKYLDMKKTLMMENKIEQREKMIYICIDYIYDNDTIYSMKDYDFEKFQTFLGNLTDENMKKMEYWIDHLPTYTVKAQQKCPGCGSVHELKYDDMNTFFLS